MTMHPDKLRNILQLPGEYNFSRFLIIKREDLVTCIALTSVSMLDTKLEIKQWLNPNRSE